VTGEPITVYARSRENRPTRNLDTFDPNRKRTYEAFSFEFRARPGGANVFGGLSVERQLEVQCTAPDDPNSLRFCDDRQNGVPFRKNFKLAGSLPLPWDITFSAVLQSNEGIASRNNATGGMYMGIVRGSSRYPASCPAPCPAGQVIMPTAVFGQPSMNVQLVDGSTLFSERITQLDFKISRTFRAGRVTVTPTFEVFNINNSDAIISYSSTNVLVASYLRPNSIMQPRFYGFGFTTRW